MDLFGTDAEPVFRDQAVGWGAFSDVQFIAEMAVVLLISVALSALIAYHPSTRSKASSLEEIEQPKTFIMYAMVGAVIALIVRVQPHMALVVFGIGGLLRFRTNIGEAKDTGRVILVTVVGLCCGLQLYVIAVLATFVGWLLVWMLERHAVERLVIQGLERDTIGAAADRYAQLLRKCGCTVVGEQKNVKKGTVALTYRAPRDLDRSKLEREFSELPDEVRGAFDWEIA